MQVIPVNRVVDKKRIIGKKQRAKEEKEEEEKHKGSLTKNDFLADFFNSVLFRPSFGRDRAFSYVHMR
jgi:hypothetical protein